MIPERQAVIRKGGQEFLPGTQGWFREARETTIDHKIAAAGIIHASAVSLLGDEFAGIVERHLARSGFSYKTRSVAFSPEHENIVESIAMPIMRMARHAGIGQENPLFTAMVARVYLIRAAQTVQLLRSQEPVTRRRIDPQTKEVIETTTVDLREEAQSLANRRSAGMQALQEFIEANFPEGEQREVAIYLGYAVEFPPVSTRKTIGPEVAKKGVAGVLPQLRARAQALGDIE